jgi:hypothetical protein
MSHILRDPKLLKDILKVDFLTTGLTLIPEEGSCPFCETQFKPGDLQQEVQLRLSAAETAARIKQEVDKIAGQISDELGTTLSSLKQVLAVANMVNADAAIQKLKLWEADINIAIRALSNPISQPSLIKDSQESLERQKAPHDIQPVLIGLQAEVKTKYPRLPRSRRHGTS